jgi:hypothetical protein
MKIRLFFIAIGILVCVCFLIANGPVSAQSAGQPAKAAAPAAGPSKSDCLNCHGPFDKIIESTGNYVAPSGEKLSPHRYVPHDSKKDDDIPECANCHTAHPLDPLPAQGSVDLSKANVQWCYATCHHAKNFTSCKQCHGS